MIPPRRAYTIALNVAGDTWQDALDELRRFAEEVEAHGPECGLTSGGCASGGWITVTHDPSMTHDRYMEAIASYRRAATKETI